MMQERNSRICGVIYGWLEKSVGAEVIVNGPLRPGLRNRSFNAALLAGNLLILAATYLRGFFSVAPHRCEARSHAQMRLWSECAEV